jgi:signal transduction histidine kinase
VGQIEPRHEPVDLTALASEVVGQFQALQAEPVRARITVEPMPHALGDATLLRPALVNLIGNALKFSRHREQPVVRISAEPGPKPGELTLSVRDNGMGFDPAKADQLFEPFQRLHGAQIEGHGVGLSIVRRAVERLGGRLRAEGLPDQGACFQISLPAATQTATQTATSTGSPADRPVG